MRDHAHQMRGFGFPAEAPHAYLKKVVGARKV